MPEEREFRIGELGATSQPSAPGAGSLVDPGLFPTLAAWVALPSPERTKRKDAIAEQARRETRPQVQAALQTALRLLSEIPLNDGGRR